MIHKLCQLIVKTYFNILYKVKIEGRKDIPKNTNFIYAINHRSNADPPIAAAYIPGKISFMAKEELFRNPFFGTLIRVLGAFPVARGKGDTVVIDTAIARLKSGKNLMIFPEGTRSKTGKVGKGHTGAALIAARSGYKIIPVGIIFGEKLSFRSEITIKFGQPIDPVDYCEICEQPNPRQLVKLKNKYMEDIKDLVYGEEGEEGFIKRLEERNAKAKKTSGEEKTDE